MSLKTFLSNTAETRELHQEPGLRTNYYRNNFNQVLEAIQAIAQEEQLEIKSINKIHKEIYMLGNGYDIIVTISEITPVELGVDFKVNWFSGFGFNKPKKRVIALYAELKERLRFKGVSLHP
ncbi:MAG: hypothetical protein WC152_02470 [Candidatus Izemoplasmatales bacterium]